MTATGTDMSAEVRKAYDQFVESHWGEIHPPELAVVMFNAGGRHAVKAMVEFGDVVPQLHRIEDHVKRILQRLETFEP